ncbi:MAG TPA: SAM-dependent methyltransferase, partial [Spirochaetia bacterium]|nr:SAM-dependent methyltransferase [Spirochaetia bacterium]
MAFDNASRGALQRLVSEVRLLLDQEFSTQLASIYGIQVNGEMASLDDLTHLSDDDFVIASILRKRIAHLGGTSQTRSGEAVSRVIREQAFTILNRFAAMRMAEERKIVRQCLGRGYESEGFKLYLAISGSSMGERFERYRAYLQSLFD